MTPLETRLLECGIMESDKIVSVSVRTTVSQFGMKYEANVTIRRPNLTREGTVRIWSDAEAYVTYDIPVKNEQEKKELFKLVKHESN